MAEYSKALGDSVFRRRKTLGWTQADLAETTGVTEQTIRKIEHYNANPQMDVLFSLVRALQIDPMEVFFPEKQLDGSARRQMEIMLAGISDAEIEELLPILDASLKIVRSGKKDMEK